MTVNKRVSAPIEQVYSKYREIRSEAHRSTVMIFRRAQPSAYAHMTITDISAHAIESYLDQWDQAKRRVQWRWEAELVKWRRRRPSHWEMAIWHKQTLCGLVLGGPSRRRSRMYVEGIEGNPGNHPLKRSIIPVALIAAEQYAVNIGSKEVWLVNPAPELLEVYSRSGYNFRPANRLLAKVLRLNSYSVKRLE